MSLKIHSLLIFDVLFMLDTSLYYFSVSPLKKMHICVCLEKKSKIKWNTNSSSWLIVFFFLKVIIALHLLFLLKLLLYHPAWCIHFLNALVLQRYLIMLRRAVWENIYHKYLYRRPTSWCATQKSSFYSLSSSPKPYGGPDGPVCWE